jgi:hypothetical protein
MYNTTIEDPHVGVLHCNSSTSTAFHDENLAHSLSLQSNRSSIAMT